jgi:leucyl/phenylalanyl-tRNA--protein transferase
MKGELVGGLYGVSVGKCFFGESMFAKVSNASKTALIILTQRLQALGFAFIDCQVYTPHLESLGARMIPRTLFLKILAGAVKEETLPGDWGRLNVFQDVNKGVVICGKMD